MQLAQALRDAITRGDSTIGGEGGIPPVIDTKSMGTAPTEGNTEYSLLLAQSKRDHLALQVIEGKLRDLTATVAAAGGGCRRCHNPNNNPPDTSNKPVGTVYCKWNNYCHSCGVVICDKLGCGVGSSADYNRKKEGHKPDATFANKMGGNTKRDHLWNLWCDPNTNKSVTMVPAGAPKNE